MSVPTRGRASREAVLVLSGAQRLVLSLVVGVSASIVTWYVRADLMRLSPSFASDFAQLWHAARALRDGIDPYSVTGPGRAFEWRFPLLYPMPAVVVAVPFSLLPLPIAEAIFVGLGSTALAWALTREHRWSPTLWVFWSFAMYRVCTTAQWSPLVTASALAPLLGFLLACKPTIGLALFAAYPSWRTLVTAAVFVGVTIVLWPAWISSWLAALPTATHMIVPVLEWRSGGPLLLLALVAWRRPAARLLLAMACVPQTPSAYEVVPLFLVANTFIEGAALAALSLFWQFAAVLLGPYASYEASMAMNGRLEVALIYLPSLVIVLRHQLPVLHPRLQRQTGHAV